MKAVWYEKQGDASEVLKYGEEALIFLIHWAQLLRLDLCSEWLDQFFWDRIRIEHTSVQFLSPTTHMI